jgi:xanthine dehydrogenase accessory factor
MLSTDSILERAAELKARGVPFVLATVVRCESPTSAKPGAKAIVDAGGAISGWIGGGCTQPAVASVAKKALADGQPRLIRVSPTRSGEPEEGILDFGMTCHSGGTVDIFLEPFGSRPNLLIIGASPAAQSLAGLAAQVGFEVFVSAPGADRDMFPAARQLFDGTDLAGIGCGTPDFVLVATQGKRDEAGLEAALGTGAGHIAFIASERKAAKLRAFLKERGHDAKRVDEIVSPAGVEIGAVTPEEIALSVLAGLVKARRTLGAPVSEAEPVRPQGASTQQPAASAIDPICGMTVGVATAEFRSEYRGASYYFCCAGCQQRFEKSPERFVAGAGTTA